MKFLKIISLFITLFSAFAFPASAVHSTNQADENPKEIYGNQKHDIKIRITNGGAGPTGILKALAEDYLSINKQKKFAIAWYQNTSLYSLKLLKEKKIDLALIYEPIDAKKAVNNGFASNLTPIFNDHFIIVGPKKNSAKIQTTDSPSIAFAKIAKYGDMNLKEKLFLSRNDFSGTNVKERLLWTLIHQSPYNENAHWYFKYPVFPKDALLKADQEEMYTITDWGTWITNEDKIKNTKILIQGGEDLLNPCLALLQKNPEPEALEFLQYLKRSRAQELIRKYGLEKKQGKAFFTPASQIYFNH